MTSVADGKLILNEDEKTGEKVFDQGLGTKGPGKPQDRSGGNDRRDIQSQLGKDINQGPALQMIITQHGATVIRIKIRKKEKAAAWA